MTLRVPTMPELWSTASEHMEPEELYWDRWEVVRLIRDASEHRPISREEVATWRPRPQYRIRFESLIAASWYVEEAVPDHLASLCDGQLAPDGSIPVAPRTSVD